MCFHPVSANFLYNHLLLNYVLYKVAHHFFFFFLLKLFIHFFHGSQILTMSANHLYPIFHFPPQFSLQQRLRKLSSLKALSLPSSWPSYIKISPQIQF